jgi:hypothetical protein
MCPHYLSGGILMNARAKHIADSPIILIGTIYFLGISAPNIVTSP